MGREPVVEETGKGDSGEAEELSWPGILLWKLVRGECAGEQGQKGWLALTWKECGLALRDRDCKLSLTLEEAFGLGASGWWTQGGI